MTAYERFSQFIGGACSNRNFFFFNDTATTEIYTLSLHDALPIYRLRPVHPHRQLAHLPRQRQRRTRSEEHTSELQSRFDLVCRLLLEKKKKLSNFNYHVSLLGHPLVPWTTLLVSQRINRFAAC